VLPGADVKLESARALPLGTEPRQQRHATRAKERQMATQVCAGAQMTCSMGLAPSVFNALPKIVMAGGKPAGNIQDFVPIMNIAPFGMCQSPSNPVVASATAAASGVLTPMPCVPATASPWVPGSVVVQVAGSPALNQTSTLQCLWGGAISVTHPGQTAVQLGA
jgi:PAB1-binding protein PBP1